jgi:hypothetical protein
LCFFIAPLNYSQQLEVNQIIHSLPRGNNTLIYKINISKTPRRKRCKKMWLKSF